MIAHSSKEVRAAVSSRGFNEVDKVDRPQPGGAGCGHLFYPICADVVLGGQEIAAQLSAVNRAFEIISLTKKFQRLSGTVGSAVPAEFRNRMR